MMSATKLVCLALVCIYLALSASAGTQRKPRRPKPGPLQLIDDENESPPDLFGTAIMTFRNGFSLLQTMFTESEEEDDAIFKMKEKEIEMMAELGSGKRKPRRPAAPTFERKGRRGAGGPPSGPPRGPPRGPPGGPPPPPGSRQDLDDHHGGGGTYSVNVGKHPPQNVNLRFTHLQPKDPTIEEASYGQLQAIHSSMHTSPLTYHLNIDKMGFWNWWQLLLSIIRQVYCLFFKHHLGCRRLRGELYSDHDPFFNGFKRSAPAVTGLKAQTSKILTLQSVSPTASTSKAIVRRR